MSISKLSPFSFPLVVPRLYFTLFAKPGSGLDITSGLKSTSGLMVLQTPRSVPVFGVSVCSLKPLYAASMIV